MTGKTISDTVTRTVTLGVGGYGSPLSITGSGEIAPSAYSATGLVLAAGGAVDTIRNAGYIFGGSGAYGSTGGGGGAAVDLTSAFSFSNAGVIAAGNGGDAEYTGGAGGTALGVAAAGMFTNTGQINGGAGGVGYDTGGGGGDGVVFSTSATLTNSGVIRGGNGGSSSQPNYNSARGGYAVEAIREDAVTNTGLIIGGAGGISGYSSQPNDNYNQGGVGGQGILLITSVLDNAGTLAGGAGNGNVYASQGGYGGDAAYLTGLGTLNNTGVIIGGNGGFGYANGGHGGVGVYVQLYSTLTNKGTITGGNGSATDGQNAALQDGYGGGGVAVASYSSASNSGVIFGGNGGAASAYYAGGANGGAGVAVDQSNFTNSGRITGGNAGATPGFKYFVAYNNNGAGGAGLDAGNDATVTNSGTITGGAGGEITSNGGTAGQGGTGVFLTDATVTNKGVVTGGGGGIAPQSQYNTAYGGVGGTGVFIGAGGKLVNDGLIRGGLGGYDIYIGATGGAGVIIDGGVFTNAGTVKAGYGGSSQHGGNSGDAVYFAGAGGTLIAAVGATFIGNVVGSHGGNNVLELTGSSSSALTGIGSQFIGIDLIKFANGASRAVEGSVTGLPEISGFAAHDKIILDGFVAIPAYTYDQTRFDRIILDGSGGKYAFVNMTNFLAKDLEVTAGGGKTTLTGVADSATNTLASGDEEIIRAGGVSGATIKAGAQEDVMSGGTAASATIAGGTLYLEVGARATGMIAFSGSGGSLMIETVKMPGAVISGFAAGDDITLAAVAYNKNDTVSVKTAGTVTISGPGVSYDLKIAGAKVGETDFSFSAGSVLTRGKAATPAMAFITPPPAAHRQTAGGLVHPAPAAVSAQLPAPSPATTPTLLAGLWDAPYKSAFGGIETTVTLHATSPYG